MIKPTRVGIAALLGILLLNSSPAHAQGLQVTLNLSPHPSMRIADWQSHRETVILLVSNTSKATTAKIQATLSLNGSVVASTRPDAMPILNIPQGQSSFNGGDLFPASAIVFSGDAKQTTARSGILPDGNYELCVTLSSADSREIVSNHDCRNFFLAKYSLPQLLQPADGSNVIAGLEPTIFFTWTPLVPAPTGNVNYRLRLVELLPKQDVKQAILNNRPVFERTVSSIAQMPWPQEIRLPNDGGSFAWSIQPEDADGLPLVMPERFAEPFTLVALPSQEQCLKLLAAVSAERETVLAAEERYWRDYSALLRIRKELQDAEDRADVYEIKRLEADLKSAEALVRSEEAAHEKVRTNFDAAIQQYKECIGR